MQMWHMRHGRLVGRSPHIWLPAQSTSASAINKDTQEPGLTGSQAFNSAFLESEQPRLHRRRRRFELRVQLRTQNRINSEQLIDFSEIH